MVSLLLSKDHTGFRDQDEDIVSLDDHELVLLKEKAMLEEVEHGVAMELPHSNQEVSQSYQKVSSDVQLTEPRAMHEEQLSLVGEENVQQMTHAADEQTLLRKEKLSLLLPNKELTNEQVNSGSTLDKNTSKGRTDHPERLTNVNMEPSTKSRLANV
ncbi:hypothetical protein DNTS_002550 [Danionella cerebrum]|uniref:Uncharacterized protein n=1 Tax=Danionella cerebrum TaxID=2873325 RepID=A0A553MSN8_9TELE|nr:hypothetical protein DNTS_002550 [Danionella translucida]